MTLCDAGSVEEKLKSCARACCAGQWGAGETRARGEEKIRYEQGWLRGEN